MHPNGELPHRPADINPRPRGRPKMPLPGGGHPLPVPPRVATSGGKPLHHSCLR